MNIFSGARRIAFIIAAIIVSAGLYNLFTSKPSVTLYFQIPSYGLAATPADDCNIFESAFERVSFKTKEGTPFDVGLCFLSSEAQDGRMLIPYTEEDGQILMNERHSPDVTKYTAAFARHVFKLSESDYLRAEESYSSQYWYEKGRVIGGFGFGLFLFWLSVWTIGWIVRGFMSIPRGQDHRISSAVPQK
jgi:hypothetical protein